MSSAISDLVLDSKLDTSFHPNVNEIRHVRASIGTSTRHRRVQTEEVWQRRKRIGSGAYGAVWLEQCVAGPRKDALRALKEIRKDDRPKVADYNRELHTIAKFSRSEVCLGSAVPATLDLSLELGSRPCLVPTYTVAAVRPLFCPVTRVVL
jgi:hypothetical protein